MDASVVDWLRDALRGQASEEQTRDVLAGWQCYFDQLEIPESEQRREFDAVMRMRVAAGSISVIADDVDAVLRRRP